MKGEGKKKLWDAKKKLWDANFYLALALLTCFNFWLKWPLSLYVICCAVLTGLAIVLGRLDLQEVE